AHAGADRAAHPATARSAARLRADRARVLRRRDGSRPLRRIPGSEARRCYYSPPSGKPRASEVHMARAGEVDSSRREFVQSAASVVALAAAPVALSAAGGSEADKAAVLAQIPAMHEANVKRLQDWIALPSIAAENRNYPQGAEYMAKLAREAGFAGVKLIPTSGKPGVFGKLDAGARTTVGIYFMYDVKQFEPSEWSSPPLEARLAGRERDGGVLVSLGAKGVVELELISSGERWGRGPAHDVHSSLEAQVDSPSWHLVQALNTLVGADGHTPAVDGFFEKARPLTAA